MCREFLPPGALCSPALQLSAKTETDFQRLIDAVHRLVIQPPHVFFETLFINGAYLFQQHDGIPCQAAAGGMELYMGALSFWLVIAAAITVGLKRLPTSFCTISTGRMPPCSEPTTGLKSA